MKRTGKLFALLAAIVMALVLVPQLAWAADGAIPNKGSITISGAKKDETYRAWRILTLASFNDENHATDYHSTDAYSYVIETSSAWVGFFTNSANAGYTYFDVDTSNPVTINSTQYYIVTPKPDIQDDPATTDTNESFIGLRNPFADNSGSKDETSEAEYNSESLVQKFAQDALAYAISYNSNAGIDANFTNTASNDSDSFSLTTEAPLGYYLVDSSLGTLCSLDTNNPNATIYEKNAIPGAEKKVKEDRNLNDTQLSDQVSAYQDVNDATIGDTIHYRTVIDVTKGAHDYVLHDTMEPGLTYLPNTLKVYFVKDAASITETNTALTNWVELTNASTVTWKSHTYTTASHRTPQSLLIGDFFTTSSTVTHDTGALSGQTHTFDVSIYNNKLTCFSIHTSC